MAVSITTITGAARNYIEIFFRRKWLFLIPSSLLAGLSLAYSFTVSPMYRTASIVLVEEEKTENPILRGISLSRSVRDRLETIVKVLLSRPILEQVINELNLDMGINNPVDYETLINQIRNSISVSLVSNEILKITGENKDPVVTQKIVNTITNLFIKHNVDLQMKETRSGIEFLRSQKDVYEQKLKDAEEALRKFKEQYQDILSVKGSEQVAKLLGPTGTGTAGQQAPQPLMNVEVLRYTGYKDNLIELQLQLKDAYRKREYLLKKIQGEGEYIISERAADPTLRQLEQELLSKEIELMKLSVDATEKHPVVIRIKKEIEELKGRIRQRQSEKVAGDEKESLNPIHQKLKMDLNDLDQEIESLKTKTAVTELYVKESREAISKIPEKEQQLAALQRDYAINERIYAELTDKLESAYITERLELQEKGTKFRIVEPAVIPLQPYKPNRPFIVLGGFGIGAAIGIGLIFISELTDHSFLEINQLRNFLNIPVLGAISQILTLEEAEEIRAKRRLGILFLVVFLFALVLGAAVKYILSRI